MSASLFGRQQQKKFEALGVISVLYDAVLSILFIPPCNLSEGSTSLVGAGILVRALLLFPEDVLVFPSKTGEYELSHGLQSRV